MRGQCWSGFVLCGMVLVAVVSQAQAVTVLDNFEFKGTIKE